MKTMYKELLESLYKGDASCLTSDVIYNINNIVLSLLNKEPLNSLEQEIVQDILHISNIIYNNTDKSILVLEDGIYDLLLQKYKRYDSNYQVGAEPILFKNTNQIIQNTDNNENTINAFSQFIPYDSSNMLFKNELTNMMYYNSPIVPINKNNIVSKRLRNVSHKYPSLVGTLDKVKFTLDIDARNKGVYNNPNVSIFERDFLQKHIRDGIVNPYDITLVLELKYDGVSVEAEVTNQVLNARTRGDTGIDKASDLTPILAGYPFHNADGYDIQPFGMKFEAIIEKQNLYYLSQESGKRYVNSRNAIIGILGSSDAAQYAKYITLVPLATSHSNMNRIEEIEFMNKYYTNGRICQYAVIRGDYNSVLYQVKRFVEEAENIRDSMPFMYDGVVVSYLDDNIRKSLGRKNSVNKYSIAIKFNAKTKLTRVRNISYTVGANGDITPMIHYDPVEFYGMINTKSSGHSYKRFYELALRPGDIIQTEYVNDVMVYITKMDCEENMYNPNPPFQFITHCPECGSKLIRSESGKNIYCLNHECPARVNARMTNMLKKLGFKGFSEESVKALGIKSFKDFMTLTEERASILGTINCTNILNAIDRFHNTPINDYIIIGALGFDNIASAKWKIILKDISLEKLITDNDMSLTIGLNNLSLDGIAEKTIITIINERKYFINDLIYVYNNMHNVVYSNNKNNTDIVQSKKVIRFSGIRDDDLENKLNLMGHDCTSGSLTNKTDILLVPFNGYDSTKVSKAMIKGIKIIPLDEFKLNMDTYLSE